MRSGNQMVTVVITRKLGLPPAHNQTLAIYLANHAAMFDGVLGLRHIPLAQHSAKILHTLPGNSVSRVTTQDKNAETSIRAVSTSLEGQDGGSSTAIINSQTNLSRHSQLYHKMIQRGPTLYIRDPRASCKSFVTEIKLGTCVVHDIYTQ